MKFEAMETSSIDIKIIIGEYYILKNVSWSNRLYPTNAGKHQLKNNVAFLDGSVVKSLPAKQESWVQSLGQGRSSGE